jgi:TetR/AcrR family transcriptional regulator, lmrAB and yxaGH operons repressor
VASDTRDRLIRATSRLLRSQGYAGTGLNQVTATAKAPRGSMYFHFPGGKQELAAAAVDRFGDRVSERLAERLASSASVREAVVGYFDDLADGLSRTNFQEGCAVGTVSLEAAAHHEVLGAATARALQTWTQLFADALEAEGHPPAEAHGLATLVVAAMEGAIVLAKGQGSTAPATTIGATLDSLLASPRKSRTRQRR